ncbi:hypothetical protein K8R32_02790 [bacterium]|nr:hypothetical protein [bacterium]
MTVKTGKRESIEEPIEVDSIEFSSMAGDKVLEMHRKSQGNEGNKKSLERAIARDKKLRRDL